MTELREGLFSMENDNEMGTKKHAIATYQYTKFNTLVDLRVPDDLKNCIIDHAHVLELRACYSDWQTLHAGQRNQEPMRTFFPWDDEMVEVVLLQQEDLEEQQQLEEFLHRMKQREAELAVSHP
jgi:hypothetical protein